MNSKNHTKPTVNKLTLDSWSAQLHALITNILAPQGFKTSKMYHEEIAIRSDLTKSTIDETWFRSAMFAVKFKDEMMKQVQDEIDSLSRRIAECIQEEENAWWIQFAKRRALSERYAQLVWSRAALQGIKGMMSTIGPRKDYFLENQRNIQRASSGIDQAIKIDLSRNA